MSIVKVSSKHQIVLPKAVRETLGIKKNDLLLFKVRDHKVELDRLDKELARHVGTVKLKKPFKTLRKEFNETMRKKAIE